MTTLARKAHDGRATGEIAVARSPGRQFHAHGYFAATEWAEQTAVALPKMVIPPTGLGLTFQGWIEASGGPVRVGFWQTPVTADYSATPVELDELDEPTPTLWGPTARACVVPPDDGATLHWFSVRFGPVVDNAHQVRIVSPTLIAHRLPVGYWDEED